MNKFRFLLSKEKKYALVALLCASALYLLLTIGGHISYKRLGESSVKSSSKVLEPSKIIEFIDESGSKKLEF
ncbi:MAG: hypothetical protein HYS98_00665 [Deltaproteobacteria bacterium]|nr:hypothetical protein [Deltaproteobacteria bacterium]